MKGGMGVDGGQAGQDTPIWRRTSDFCQAASANCDPSLREAINFWSGRAQETGRSRPYYLSGWIAAFCFWNEDGQLLYRDGPVGLVTWESFAGYKASCALGGILFYHVNTEEIPCGMVSVPVRVNDNGDIYTPRSWPVWSESMRFPADRFCMEQMTTMAHTAFPGDLIRN